MTITIPPELAIPLTEEAGHRGMTPESLALEGVRHVLPAARLSETPGFWSRPHGCTWNTRGGVAYIGQTVQSRAHVDKPLHIKNAI